MRSRKYWWVAIASTFAVLMLDVSAATNRPSLKERLGVGGRAKKAEQIQACVRSGAWLAYLKDDDGKLAPVRDTQNTESDEDWLGLRFSDYEGPRIRLGVLTVINRSPRTEDSEWSRDIAVPVAGIEDLLLAALYNTKRFDIIARKRKDEVLKEQTSKEVIEPSPQAVMNAGKLLAVQYLVYGTVNEWIPERGRKGLRGLGPFGGSKKEAEVAITFKLADVGTGQILFTSAERAKLGEWGIDLSSQTGMGGGTEANTPVSYAVRACVNKAAYKIADYLKSKKWAGAVVDIKGPDVYVNAGAQQGMTPETMLSVFAIKGTVKDPRTGQIYGDDLRGIGTLKVMTLQNGFSIARVVDGCKGLKKGDRVELATPPEVPVAAPECTQMLGTLDL
jgi:curli biogenesis system outer membrane secretion channel CsgG